MKVLVSIVLWMKMGRSVFCFVPECPFCILLLLLLLWLWFWYLFNILFYFLRWSGYLFLLLQSSSAVVFLLHFMSSINSINIEKKRYRKNCSNLSTLSNIYFRLARLISQLINLIIHRRVEKLFFCTCNYLPLIDTFYINATFMI